jgi:hypothetical protein
MGCSRQTAPTSTNPAPLLITNGRPFCSFLIYGVIDPMKAKELFRVKEAHGAGIVEIVIWQVPEPVPPSEHPYKYRLVYVVGGKRIVGYDNELGKGDHKHLGDQEEVYRFVNPKQLMVDFMADVKGAGE